MSTKAKHTLRMDGHYVFDGERQISVEPDYARRIVAALNACTGIPTEALEAGVVAEMVARLTEVANVAEGLRTGRLSAWTKKDIAEALRLCARAVLAKVKAPAEEREPLKDITGCDV